MIRSKKSSTIQCLIYGERKQPSKDTNHYLDCAIQEMSDFIEPIGSSRSCQKYLQEEGEEVKLQERETTTVIGRCKS